MKHPIPVTLTESDRASLQTFIHVGKANARTFTRARVLLKAAEGWTDKQICEAFDISRNTAIRVRQLYLGGGLEAVLHDKRQDRHRLHSCSQQPRPLDRSEAFRQSGRTGVCGVHLARNHSPVTEKNELKPWQHEQWCIPEVGAE